MRIFFAVTFSICCILHLSAQSRTANVMFTGNVAPTVSVGVSGNSFYSNTAVMKYGTRTKTTLGLVLRSNVPYKLTAISTAEHGIVDGPPTPDGGVGLSTGDIGFGIVSPIDHSGPSVVGGSSRVDLISPGFDASDGVFKKTLHDIYGSVTQILSGERISASGDNSSSDNFISFQVGVSLPPANLRHGVYNGTVTFVISGLP